MIRVATRGSALALAQARLVAVPGAGHMPNLEAQDRFNAELAQFLSQIASPT